MSAALRFTTRDNLAMRPVEPPTAPWPPIRRDREPHRGELLCRVATACVAYGYLAFLVLPGVVAVCGGTCISLLACRDLRLMRAGRMEPAGWELTATAHRRGTLAALIPLGVWLGMIAATACWWMMGKPPV